jgi:hypothetical protein
MSGLFCAGDVYFNRLDASGSPTRLISFGNTTKFAIKESADQKLRTSKGRDTFGQALGAVYVKKPTEISIAGDEMDAVNLAAGLLGTSSALAQNSSTVTDEAVTAKLGVWVPLAKGNVSAVMVKNSAGTTTYVEGTDYQYNAPIGMVMALASGAITDAESLKVSYAAGAIAGNVIAGGTQPTVKGALILDGVNLETQKPIVVRVDQATLTPNKEIDFKAGDFAGLELNGILITLPGSTSPYSVELRG